MSFIYSKSTGGFYPVVDKPAYVSAGTWPSDGVEVTAEQREGLLAAESEGQVIGIDANGMPIAQDRPGPSVEQVRSLYESAAQSLLDSTAKGWGYDSLISAASYASSGVAQYKAESDALVTWRDTVWQAAYNIEASVKNGTAIPATAADFLAILPPAPTRPTV